MLNYKKIVLNKVGFNDNNDNKMIWYDIWYDVMIYKYNYLCDISNCISLSFVWVLFNKQEKHP